MMAEAAFERLLELMALQPKWLVLTGAGISSSSGIPTYRDHSGQWQRRDPIQHKDFLADHATRQRYWARSLVGWKYMQNAKPNRAHQALVEFERCGYSQLLVTQNVDGLHQQAGSHRVVDLHGRMDQVLCLECDKRHDRNDVQVFLEHNNPALVNFLGPAGPDGDADVDGLDLTGVRVPVCEDCGGVLKPDVVFFGDNVPRARVATAQSALQQAGALLVIGSSLMVFSGYRFCRQAAQQHIPIVIINRGVTRADELVDCKVEGDCAEVLSRLMKAIR